MTSEQIINLIEEIAANSGLLPTTICQNALGNAKFYDRQKKRLIANRNAAEKLQQFARTCHPKKPASVGRGG